jgi:hypothetical protein
MSFRSIAEITQNPSDLAGFVIMIDYSSDFTGEFLTANFAAVRLKHDHRFIFKFSHPILFHVGSAVICTSFHRVSRFLKGISVFLPRFKPFALFALTPFAIFGLSVFPKFGNLLEFMACRTAFHS